MKQLKQQYFRPVLPLFREHRAGLLACLGCLCLLFSALPLAAADRFVSFSNGDFLLNEGGKVGIFVDETDQKGISLAAHNLAEDLRLFSPKQRMPASSSAPSDTPKPSINSSKKSD